MEYCNANNWATLCDDNFTAVDAKVVCRQAGYTGDGVILINSYIHILHDYHYVILNKFSLTPIIIRC